MVDTSFDESGKSITQPTPPTPQTDTISDNSPRPQILLSSSIVEGNKKRKLTSKVWDHFTKQIIDGQTRAVCNYCTSTLKVGEAEKLVQTLFEVAVVRQPSVIFMDEAGIYYSN
ncbi:hypothetical protein Cni_G16972 [Canna indica]|uniref:BED-type domain-containing protein n=1 Tax=Canna indica TaxID=4628 RepID=A0AAQ3QHB6_9LILI|nr:hypothetical protein Cni_G16972 [Canna indica]